MKLYSNVFAPSPRRVRMFAAEKGVTLEIVNLDIAKSETQGAAFLALNPMGDVPVLVLDDGKQRAYLVGDTIHHPVQIERPQWSSRFCFDAAQSAQTRTKFIEDVSDTGAWVIPAHFAPPCAVQVVAEASGFWFKTATS